jgi:hypothetical protein
VPVTLERIYKKNLRRETVYPVGVRLLMEK